MKKIVAIVILFFVILVGWLYYINLTNVHEFRLNGYTKINKDNVLINKAMYVSLDLKFHGNAKPIIKEIRFIKSDGSFLSKEDPDLSITPFIDKTGATLANASGVITEEEAKSLKLLDNYVPVENYQVDKQDLNVVLEVIIKNSNYTNNLTALEIDYELLGKEETKQILFEGLLE